jgi:hypothetical protein
MVCFTKNLTSGTITINKNQGASFVSVQPNSSGSCTVIGSVGFGGMNSDAITLSAGEVWSFGSQNTQNPIDGITITWVSGSVKVCIGL